MQFRKKTEIMTATSRKGVQKMELTYRQEGDYLLPNLTVPESPKVGKFGTQRLEFLRKHRNPIYTGMLLGGTLNEHLEEIDRTADEMLENLTDKMARTEGVTEELKASDPMEWIRRMTGIRQRAEEMVLNDLIYN